MIKYTEAQIKKFHEYREMLVKLGVSKYVATGAAFFAATKKSWDTDLKRRRDDTAEVQPYDYGCGFECCGTAGLEVRLNNGKTLVCD